MDTCRICAAAAAHRVFDVREMLTGLRDVHRYFECRSCGCLQIDKEPADLAKYYAGSYYSYQPIDAKPAWRRLMLRYRNEYAAFGRNRIGRVLYQRFPTHEFVFLQPIRDQLRLDSSIVDVGCGSGILLNIFREGGFSRLLGVDPFIGADIRYPNGVTIRKMFIDELQGSHDLIMYHHSFEHLWDPVATLRTTYDRLRPGGHCVLAVPTVSGYAWKHYGVNWVQLDAPRHLYLHSLESLEIVVRAAGFELLHSTYDSAALQFWGSEQYLQDMALTDPRSFSVDPSKSIFSAGQIADWEREARALNASRQGDQVMFYLRRPAA